ncbi:MAG: hypothetical protein M3Y87_30600, partial [Myxococcota bacterium]|nr:hypothetical protein [Myxococcota bacterium]
MRASALALALVISVSATWTSAARAHELELAIDSECEQPPIAEEVASALGRPLGAGAVSLRARVAIRREGREIRVVIGLEREGARSERVLVAANCERAARTAALVLALALDSELDDAGRARGRDAATPEPADRATAPARELVLETTLVSLVVVDDPGPSDAVDRTAARSADTAPSVPVGTARDVRAFAIASALVDGGSLPGIAGGARAGGGVGLGDGAV